MINSFIDEITNFIFVADEPNAADAIFIPGGSFPELPEYAAELYHRGFAPVLVPSGGLSVKLKKWHQALDDIRVPKWVEHWTQFKVFHDNPEMTITLDERKYLPSDHEIEFFEDLLIKNAADVTASGCLKKDGWSAGQLERIEKGRGILSLEERPQA